MKKSFEYDLTKYDPSAPTKTEEFLTADGVKTLTTDANNGAVLIQDEVDGDSLNPVTAAAVATAIEAGGGGTEYTAGDGVAISEGEISAKVDGTTISINADGELEAIGGGGSLPTPTNTSVLLGITRTPSQQPEPAWLSSGAVRSVINNAGANTWQAESNELTSTVDWTVSVTNNVITLTPDTLIVPNDRASHFYIQVPAMLQQLSSGWTGGLIHADVDFKYKCTDFDPNVAGVYAYDRHRVVRVTQYEATQWPQLQIAAELLISNHWYHKVGSSSIWQLFDASKNCGISQVTITITDDSGNALPLYSDTATLPVLAWLD